MVVTGSRIPRPQYEGTIPGAQVTRDTIEDRGFTNAIQILNDIPLVGPPVSAVSTGTAQPANLGAQYVDLLDIGSARTLTLVNGRRMVSNNGGTIFVAGNEPGNQVDASTIPPALIERVDVLTVGGAAAYGSDAIAGVVNYILRENFEGFDLRTSVRGYEGGQGEVYSLGVTTGKNFLDGRLNVTLSGDFSKTDALYARDFDFLARNDNTYAFPIARRNPAYVLGSGVGSVFFPANADGLPPSLYVDSFRSHTALPGGTIWRANPIRQLQPGATAQVWEGGAASTTPNVNANFNLLSVDSGAWYSGQFFPNQPALCNAGAFSAAQISAAATANARVCNFAPASLPGSTAAEQAANAARVFAAYGVTPTAGLTQAQLNRLALDTLQANLPTAREYFQANPGLDPNLFIGSFIQGYPGVASGNAILPILAQPLRFDSSGNIVQFSTGTLGPNSPGQFGSAPGNSSDLYNATDRNVSRFEQTRAIGNLNARFDITDRITFFTENLYSDIESVNPINQQSAFSSIGSTGVENGAILVNSQTNPFLTAQNRADLAARGITGNFVLSTDYYSLYGENNEAIGRSKTFRTVNGLRGDFDVWNRRFTWELAHSYGGSDFEYRTTWIKDLEFLLAIDAVNDGGTIRCRSQTAAGAGIVGTTLPGITNNVVRVPFAVDLPTGVTRPVPVTGDVPQDQNYQPVVTQAMVDGCRPLNLFGDGRADPAALNYILAETFITNEARQEYFSGVFTGEIFKLDSGSVAFALSAEKRTESLNYGGDQLGILGRSRSAPTALTDASIDTEEYGVELDIPLVSPSMNIPFVHSLSINPAWRWVKQTGEAASFRNANGTLVSPQYDGDFENIYSIAMTYAPFQDLTFRGNVSRSVRQPGIVDLFLGSQPAFLSNGTDVCGSTQIDSGPNPAIRRRNCEAAVRALNPTSATFPTGVIDPSLSAAENDARVRTFLSTFSAAVPTFQTIVAGEPGLSPETANSYTWGFVAQPRWVPGLTFSADYVKVTVKGLISNLFATTANQFCFDSETYPNTAPQVQGLDLCPYVIRDPQFAITNGSISGFWNQGGIRVQALNINAAYGFDVSELFGDGTQDWGRVGLRTSAYNLIKYQNSPDGNFGSNTTFSQDTLARPEWKVQLTGNYTLGKARMSWTGNWQSETGVFAGNGTVVPTIDQALVRERRSYWLHSATFAYDVTERARAQLTVDNVFDTIYPSFNYEQSFQPVSFGRTYLGQLIYRF
ncbi:MULTISPECIES: TonB-dependent receptor domain-containing protein [unclassified Brevundimonas]|uniref:TonB-dependent receptor domain-containing protein n=1 Tax=unclassified Brevundimonas TaxID=2622653 RepID=UPI001431B3C9|nr:MULTISPECIES: TonB-dependent receptor [unclassified Brevundimonas]